MNGRVYDPVAGRFLSADLFVQFPENSQSYNRYSYVMNNPLSYDDPSGHIIPLLIYGGVMAYRAYSAYDTVTTAIEDVGVLADDQASTEDRIFAAVSLTASVATGTVGKKAVGIFKAAKTEAKAVRAAEKKVASKVSKKGAGTDKNTEVDAVAKREEKAGASEKFVPNPDGKKGSVRHQAHVDDEFYEMQKKFKDNPDVVVRKEVRVVGEDGKVRWIDAQAKNAKTNEVVDQVQVGRTNKNGTPVSRERRAMEDIDRATGFDTRYRSYDK